MRQFFIEYSTQEFLEQAVPEISAKGGGTRILEQAVPELLTVIPWGHHVILLKKVKDHTARIYYLRAATRFGWSRNVLFNQIKGEAYEQARWISI